MIINNIKALMIFFEKLRVFFLAHTSYIMLLVLYL
jgi:hypothetical protein